MPDAIVTRNLTKTFGPKVAVDDLSLSIPAGSMCGVIGPNGAGKTTTIRMIMSIIFPDSGELSVLGRPSAVESKDRIGYLPEERGVYKKMRVLAFLTYMAKLKGIDPGAAARKAAAWLERVELRDSGRKRCEELSKGMQQKVQFIAAVIHEPDLLILDEVFSGLDPVNRRLMRELIGEQHDQGRTILFSTHAMYEAEQLCDRILMIHNGRKVLDATLAEIRARFDPRVVIAEPLAGAAGAGEGGDLRSVAAAIGRLDHVLAAEAEPDDGVVTVQLRDASQGARALAAIAAAAPMRRVELARVSLEDVFIDVLARAGQVVSRDDLRASPRAGSAQEAVHA